MKIFFTAAIALVGLFAAFPAASDWQYTKWGMSIDQAIGASGNKLRPANPQEQRNATVNGVAPGLVGSHETGSFHFNAALYFAGSGNSLSMVKLKLQDYSQWPSLLATLRSLYGEPLEQQRAATGGGTMRWRDEKGRNEIHVLDMAPISTVELNYQPLPSAKGL
jgi:hypothetical protein